MRPAPRTRAFSAWGTLARRGAPIDVGGVAAARPRALLIAFFVWVLLPAAPARPDPPAAPARPAGRPAPVGGAPPAPRARRGSDPRPDRVGYVSVVVVGATPPEALRIPLLGGGAGRGRPGELLARGGSYAA